MAYSFANAQKAFQAQQAASQAAKASNNSNPSGGYIPPMPGTAAPAAQAPAVNAPGAYIPPMPQNAATAGGAAAPALGYGGAQYGQSGGVNRALEANQARLGSDDAFKQSEIARTQQVIAQRQAAGQDISQQQKYLTQNLGYIPPMPQQQQVQPVQQVQPQQQNNLLNTRSDADLRQQATDWYTTERADRQNAADTQTGSLKNNFDYASQLLKDNRAIEDASFAENNSPFSGATEYRKAMLQRGRGIDDTYRSQELNNQLNAISTDMYNFDKLAPERQRQIYNQLLQMERDYGISVAQLTGVFNGGRTMAGAAFDWQQMMDLAGLTGNLPNSGNAASAYGAADQQGLAGYGANGMGMQALAGMAGTRTLAGQQMDLTNKQANQDVAFGYMDRFGQLVNPQEDWSGYGRQIAAGGGPQTLAARDMQFGQDMQNRQFEYGQQRDLIGDSQWQQQFDRGRYESDRDYQFRSQQQAIQNGQWQQQFELDIDKFGFQKATEMWSQAFTETTSNRDHQARQQQLQQSMSETERQSAQQAYRNVAESGLVVQGADEFGNPTGGYTVPNVQKFRDYVLSLNLPDNVTDSIFLQYGQGQLVKAAP